jgi:hypothetical protein
VSRAHTISEFDRAYSRRGLFALELLDPVTLARVTEGVKVVGTGLAAPVPTVNSSGLFVWLGTNASKLIKISVDPQQQPFDRIELLPGDLNLTFPPAPITTVELSPRLDYPLPAGTTAARGTLLETRLPSTPCAGARVWLRWLDEDGTSWFDAPTVSHTNARGDMVVVLRMAPTDAPLVDAGGAMTVRVVAQRDGVSRHSGDLKLPQGRVADPTTLSALVLAWDELQP